MDDNEILTLYITRREQALSETQARFGASLHALAKRILGSEEDASECENDTYLSAWNTIPPEHPLPLKPYLMALCRRISIDRLRKRTADKRGGGQYESVTEELEECLADPSQSDVGERTALKLTMEKFIRSLSDRDRALFIRRYWYMSSVKELAKDLGMTQGSVKVALHRLREKLRAHLRAEGFTIDV